MIKARVKVVPRGNSLGVTIPKDVREATGLRRDDELSLIARDDGVIDPPCYSSRGRIRRRLRMEPRPLSPRLTKIWRSDHRLALDAAGAIANALHR